MSDSPQDQAAPSSASDVIASLDAKIAAAGALSLDTPETLGVQTVASTNVSWIEYHPASRQLDVMFKSGWFYHFYQVPDYVYETMLISSSKGHFVHAVLDTYSYARIY